MIDDTTAGMGKTPFRSNGAETSATAAKLTAMTDGMLARIAQAPDCRSAAIGLMQELTVLRSAVSGELWRRLAHERRASLAAVHGGTGPPGGSDAPAPPVQEFDGGLIATAMRQNCPLGVTIAAPGAFAGDALVAASGARGLHHLLVIPLAIDADRYVIVLGFGAALVALAPLLTEVDLARPALQLGLVRKANEGHMQLLHQALDMATDGAVITTGSLEPGASHRIVYVNRSFCRTTGYAEADLIGRSPAMLQGVETSPPALEELARSLRANRRASVVLLNYRKDGTPFSVRMDIAPILDRHGVATHFVALQRDITEQLNEDARLRQLHDSFRMMFDDNPLPMWVFDVATLRFLEVNRAAIAFYGWSRDEFLRMTLHQIKPAGEHLDVPALTGLRAMADHRTWVHQRADGSIVRMAGVTRAHPVGSTQAILAVLWDMTALQAAEEAKARSYKILCELAGQLRVRTDELTDAHRMAQLATWRLSADRSEMEWSNEIYTLLGRTRAEFPPSLANSIAVVHPDDRKLFARSIPVPGSDCGSRHVEARIVQPDGTLRHVRIEFRPINPDEARGALFGYVQDVSDRWHTEQALLRSEKLATLGQLTGGIAHDFNNLLTVVMLNLEEVIVRIPETDERQGILVAALQAARRGADLTSQLLAYARQAPLRPQATSVAALFKIVAPLIRRALGPDYRLRIAIEDEHCAPLVDVSQLQTAILNIALNARDAMPPGGEVLIETARVTLPCAAFTVDGASPGPYLTITVTDHGEGIAPEILSSIFEPFFTTREAGTASGLGLSMVEGFMSQSGGHITVASRPDLGTVIRLFLPLAIGPEMNAAQAEMRPGARRALLVEDQPAVLATVSRMFAQLGYEVCGVATAAEALAVLDHGTRFSVLFTDIVLPGEMDGIGLAKAVARRAPDTRILLTSGFTHHDLARSGLPDVAILMKPYKRQELFDSLSKVAPALPDSKPPG